MKEGRRREIDQAVRNLKSAETRLETARAAFATVLMEAYVKDNASLGELSKTLVQLGRPISRQRVHQIITMVEE